MSTRSPTFARARISTPVVSGVILRRIIWNVIPVAVVVIALEMVLVGDDGLLERHNLKQRLYATQARGQQIEASNAVLRARIQSLQTDPAAVQRAVGEHLLTAPTGSTIYRFDRPLGSH
jgi:cell division protein FtsB